MKYVGIDLHTNRFTCCYLSDDSKEKQMETFEAFDGSRQPSNANIFPVISFSS